MKKIVSLLLVASCMGIVLTGCGKKEDQINYAELTDQGFLSKVGEWEQEGNPAIKIKFNIDGTGKTTTNDGKDWLDMNWIYDEDILIATAKYNSRDLITDWIAKIDKEKTTLELIDTTNEIKIKYIKAGNQNIELKEQIKDEKVVGLWYRSDFDYQNMEITSVAFSLQKDKKILSGKGNYDIANKTFDLDTIYIDWYTEGNKLKLILYSGVVIEYTYEVSDTSLKLYKDNKLVISYSKPSNEIKKIK